MEKTKLSTCCKNSDNISTKLKCFTKYHQSLMPKKKAIEKHTVFGIIMN